MLQDLDEISDGKIYGSNDMVRVACHDCAGCSSCCRGMGDSILLDPYDVWRLTTGTGQSFEQLLGHTIEAGVTKGLILPHLKMTGSRECCAYLDENGRCSIHALRPGLCRIFPLGRIYEPHSIRYFLQKDACRITDRTKIKLIKWLDTPEWKKNEQFLLTWHAFRQSVEQYLTQVLQTEDTSAARTVNLFVLNLFFMQPYESDDFYTQFARRMSTAADAIKQR